MAEHFRHISQEELEAIRERLRNRSLEKLPLKNGIFDMIGLFLQTALGTSGGEGEKKRNRTPRASEHDYNNGFKF